MNFEVQGLFFFAAVSHRSKASKVQQRGQKIKFVGYDGWILIQYVRLCFLHSLVVKVIMTEGSKNGIVSWVLKLRVHLLLKGAIMSSSNN